MNQPAPKPIFTTIPVKGLKKEFKILHFTDLHASEFTEASMMLEKPGQVSTPIHTVGGVHIIQYASDIPEGEIGFENVREELHEELLASKQEYHYSDVITLWGENSGAKIYEDRLD